MHIKTKQNMNKSLEEQTEHILRALLNLLPPKSEGMKIIAILDTKASGVTISVIGDVIK